MTTTTRAAYSDGALTPLDPLRLADGATVSVTIEDAPREAGDAEVPRLAERFSRIIADARGRTFYDGMDSQLADNVRAAIIENGLPAIDALSQVLDSHGSEVETCDEIIRQVGLLSDAPTHRARLNLLADLLASPQARFRDAAALGLSFLEDPDALPYLRAAKEREPNAWLAENLEQAIEELENIRCRNI